MASSLPEYVVLKNKYNGKYLEYVHEEGAVQGYVRFSGEDVHSPRSKFHVEQSDMDDSKLVHLRCCYNNKYLVASTQESPWIVAVADEPEEDQSKWSCTLFEPEDEQSRVSWTHLLIPNGWDGYRFKHVKSGNYAALMWMGDSDLKNNCLYPESADPTFTLRDMCSVIDWKSLLVLPRLVAFKGDGEGSYLGLSSVRSTLQFASSDIAQPVVAFEVLPNPDGSIRLKSTYNGKFWIRVGGNWIVADSNTGDDKDAHFWPIKLDDQTIALRNLGNHNLCKRYTADGIYGCLSAVASTVTTDARLQVTELVLSRDIYNVNYHLSRARRYNEHAVVMATGAASNPTDKENSMDVTVAHTETETSSWSATVSLKLGVKTTLETKIPIILDGKIELSLELSTAYQWGEVHTKTNTIQTVYKVSVPPMTKVTVTAVGTTAMCDIPFSYTQTDTLMDGTPRIYEIDAGVYTGVSTYNVTYQIKHEKIDVVE